MKKRLISFLSVFLLCISICPSMVVAKNSDFGYDTLSMTPEEYLELAKPKVSLFRRTSDEEVILNICEAFLSMGRASVRNAKYLPSLLVEEQAQENDEIQYRLSEYQYLAAYWAAVGAKITSDSMQYFGESVDIDGETATASIAEYYTYYTNDDFDGENIRVREYFFILKNGEEGWEICKVTTNDPWEDDSFNYAPLDANVARTVATTVVLGSIGEDPLVAMPQISSPYRWTYYPAVSVEYAEKYFDAYYDTGGWNSLFPFQPGTDYSEGANCQNFASQCVWAGLIGNMDDVDAWTDRTALPAVTSDVAGTGAMNIWCYGKTSSANDGRCSWYSTNGFANMLANSDPSKDGPFGTTYYGNLKYAEQGSVIAYCSKGSTAQKDNLKHAMFVTAATGTYGSRDIANLKIAANSSPTNSAKEPLATYASGYTSKSFSTSRIVCGYYSEPQGYWS